jgi:hypothetical protein
VPVKVAKSTIYGHEWEIYVAEKLRKILFEGISFDCSGVREYILKLSVPVL